jgi:hypothetical protein
MWQARRANFDRCALVTALHVKTGRLLADRAQRQRIFSEIIPDNDSDPGEGMIMSLFDLDLRERLPKLAWEPGSYLLTVILQDQVSNRVSVNLVASRPATSGRLAEGQTGFITPPPGKPFPSYRADRDSPAVPERFGIELAIEERVVLTPGARCILRGSFRVPLVLQHLVGLQTAVTLSGTAEEQPTAIIPLTLLLTGADAPGPFLIPMRVPSYDSQTGETLAAEVTGTFALDLFETEALSHREPMIYYLYAFLDKILAGPFEFELLST